MAATVLTAVMSMMWVLLAQHVILGALSFW
jgi:hypothetical protein